MKKETFLNLKFLLLEGSKVKMVSQAYREGMRKVASAYLEAGLWNRAETICEKTRDIEGLQLLVDFFLNIGAFGKARKIAEKIKEIESMGEKPLSFPSIEKKAIPSSEEKTEKYEKEESKEDEHQDFIGESGC